MADYTVTISDEGVEALKWWQTKISDCKDAQDTLQRIVNQRVSGLVDELKRELTNDLVSNKTLSEIKAL